MKFRQDVFEKLLFPLHKQVYRKIQDSLDEIDWLHPGQLERLFEVFQKAGRSDTQTEIWMPGKADETLYPSLDIIIVYSKQTEHKLTTLYKSTDYEVTLNYNEQPPDHFTGSHLILNYYQHSAPKTYIVPLEYLLGCFEADVLKDGSYQLYSHTLLPLDNGQQENRQPTISLGNIADNDFSNRCLTAQKDYQSNSLIYIGITKRTWQYRYRQHCNDSGRGSNLLFHRALRGELGRIGVIEHIVERAGLTEAQAMKIEESEVEKRSLHSLYLNGLNMIPGGAAGLKYVSHFANRSGYAMQRVLTADTVESILADVQRHSFERHFKTSRIDQVNAIIASLWAKDPHYRISVITNRQNRFSFRQIQSARIWHASGWKPEKILACLHQLESRTISMKQLEKLLWGETYASIPDVLM